MPMQEVPDPWSAAVIEQNRHWLLAYLLAATGNQTSAEDIVQETFRIAYEKRDTFTSGTNFGGWLRMIAKNCLNRYFERLKKNPILLGDAISELDQVASEYEERFVDSEWMDARITAMRNCLERLTMRVRQIFEHRYREEKSAKEVAELLGMKVSAIDVTVFRARAKLVECIRRESIHG